MSSSFYSQIGIPSTSSTAIESSVQQAATSETNAAASATSSATSASAASASAVSANAADVSATQAKNDAETAATASLGYSQQAAAHVSTASGHEQAALASANYALQHSNNASTFATNSSNSATASATSAADSATSATNSATSATNSATSATASAASATSAAASLSTFQNQYLGASATAPTQDPDGSSLDLGDLYFDTAANVMKVYSDSGWVNASSSVNGTSERQTYTATAGQTTFNVTYDAGYVDVWLNGAKLLAGTDFTATSGTNIVLASPAAANDIVDIIAFGTFVFTQSDHYTKTQSDARYEPIGGSYGDSDVDAHLLTAGITLDATNDRLGVNNSSPATALDVTGTVTADGLTVESSGNNYARINSTDSNTRLYLDRGSVSSRSQIIMQTSGSETGGAWAFGLWDDETFRIEDWTGTDTTRLTIDASGNVKIGTDTDQTSFLTETTANLQIGGGLLFEAGSGNNAEILNYRTSAMVFGNGGTEDMRIDSSGNVGIGITPDYKMHIEAGGNNLKLSRSGVGEFAFGVGSGRNLVIEDKTAAAERMRIDSSGNVGIGTSSPNGKLDITGSGNTDVYINTGNNSGDNSRIFFGDTADIDVGYVSYDHGTNSMTFGVNAAERMRIDSSGNLLVGQTSQDTNETGFSARANSLNHFCRDTSTTSAGVLLLNKKTGEGTILVIQKDGSTVGSIGATSADALYIHTPKGSDSGLRFDGLYIAPCDSVGSNRDNTIDLGYASSRFDDIFATNGTIQTSDENEKQQIASLTDAEMTAAKAISKLFKTFKWNDKVEAKGDAARTHTGVIAQQVETAMSDAGLDAGNYAFFISTTWWETQTEVAAVEAVEAQDAVYDEEGNLVSEAVEAVEAQEAYTRTDTYDTQEEAPEGATERTRLGIRYPELLSFIGAATEQRLANLETRVEALEAN